MGNIAGCAVDGCMKPLKRAGYCYGHYMKNWRYGTPTPEHKPWREDLRGHHFGLLTVIDYTGNGLWLCRCECGRERKAAAGELNRTGDSATCGDRATHRRQEDAGYCAAHGRVETDRGNIRTHVCVDCGKPAKHWSYDHEDPDERLEYGISKNPIAYSLNVDHYAPRCVPCHKRFDLDHINSTAEVLNVSD